MDVLDYLLGDHKYVEGQALAAPAPVRLAEDMAALYRQWMVSGRLNLVAITHCFLDRLDCQDRPIGKTCLHAAAAVTAWGGHAYHSALHHAEVSTNAMVIAELGSRIGPSIPAEQRALLLASSLTHDINYDPRAGGRPRFAAEAESAHALDTIAERCGLGAAERSVLRCLVLATEPGFRQHLGALVRGDDQRALPDGLHALKADAALADLAAVLSDADLLSSAGLTPDWHQVQVERLRRETGGRITPEDDLRFFDRVVGTDFLSPGGRVFSPNLTRLRRAVHRAGDLVAAL
jgi:hypothetical protein